LPALAKRSGASLIVVNLSPTPVDEVADVALRGKAGALLPPVVAAALRA
jgi:NAD-dependent SIR2 family protein deacetylase